VVRSEADDLIFKHAGKSGAQIFDVVKVNSVNFVPSEHQIDVITDTPGPGRAVSATWSRKDGSSGEIKFDYLVDASGRAGVVSTKYLKNRKSNQGLKNIANWGYWSGAANYAEGTAREGYPFFEALKGISILALYCMILRHTNIPLPQTGAAGVGLSHCTMVEHP